VTARPLDLVVPPHRPSSTRTAWLSSHPLELVLRPRLPHKAVHVQAHGSVALRTEAATAVLMALSVASSVLQLLQARRA
jgi:hypothetical protein